MKQRLKYLTVFLLLLFCAIRLNAQGTLEKLKFEEAEQKYLNKDYRGAVTLLEELEKKGLKNPKVLHLKIMGNSNWGFNVFATYDRYVQFKKDVDYYLKHYDIEGLEDKYKDVYDAQKYIDNTLEISPLITKLMEKKADGYYYGKDYQNAFIWYNKVVERVAQYGSNEVLTFEGAQRNLGWLYHTGNGVEKNLTKAIEWYAKAAEQGNTNAQTNLGNIYYYGGTGVKRDYKNAIEWYEKAANQGEPNAQTKLGEMYEYGEGIEKDINKAIYWKNKIIENPKAEESLRGQTIRHMSFLYSEKKEYNEAIKWLLRNDYMIGEKDEKSANGSRNVALGNAYEGLGEWEKAYNYYVSVEDSDKSSYITGKIGLYHYEGKAVAQSYQKVYELWNISFDIKTQGYLIPLFRAILLYRTREQKEWDEDQASLSVSLIKEIIKETNGNVLKLANKYAFTQQHINERFPRFIQDKNDFFEYLAKEHNIIFE